MKKIKNYLKYFLVFLIFWWVAYASSGLMSGSFSLSNQKIVIKPEAFYTNSINADAILSWSINSLKLASNIDASKITWTIPSSSIPSSLVWDSNNSQTLSWRTLEYTLTNDDTKIPTSKAVLDKILPLYSCSTTKLYDYDLPDTDWLNQITVTKTVSITWWQYVLTWVFKCVDGSFEKVWDDVISDLYCNPGYWSNWSTNSCSEVWLWYYSTWGLNRSICTNSTNIYINLTSSTASVNPCPNTVKDEYYYMYYTWTYPKKCDYASAWENCTVCTYLSWNNCIQGVSFVKISSSLRLVNSPMKYTYTKSVSWCSYINNTSIQWSWKTSRMPTLDELKLILMTSWTSWNSFLTSWYRFWSSSVSWTSIRDTIVNDYAFYQNYKTYRVNWLSESNTTPYWICVVDV